MTIFLPVSPCIAAEIPRCRAAAELQLSKKVFSPALERTLGLIRLKVWDSLEGLDAMRFKQNRVTIENCPPGVFMPLVNHLGEIAKNDGELGKLLWRENHVSSIKDGKKRRSTFTINTINAANFLTSFQDFDFPLDSPTASFGWGIMRISNLLTGEI